MVVGVSLIGPELLTAILTVLFYHHNKSLEGEKHEYNSEIVPIDHPLEVPNDIDQDTPNDLIEMIGSSLNTDTNDNVSRATTILNSICDNILAHQKTICKLRKQCKNRLISIYDLLSKDDACNVKEIR